MRKARRNRQVRGENPRPGSALGLTGGERGIRTLEGLLTLTPLAGVRLRPLGHLSARGAAMIRKAPPAGKSASDRLPQAISRARTNSCTDSSAASSASGLLPPAWAKSA